MAKINPTALHVNRLLKKVKGKVLFKCLDVHTDKYIYIYNYVFLVDVFKKQRYQRRNIQTTCRKLVGVVTVCFFQRPYHFRKKFEDSILKCLYREFLFFSEILFSLLLVL